MRSTTSRSLELLREHGYIAENVEYWNPYARKRKDLFGFIDIMAVSTTETIGVQTTTGSNLSNRVSKIRSIPVAIMWLKAGNKIHLHGWRKVKKGKPRLHWLPLVYEMKWDGKEFVLTDLSIYY